MPCLMSAAVDTGTQRLPANDADLTLSTKVRTWPLNPKIGFYALIDFCYNSLP